MERGRTARFILFDYGNTLVPYGRREAAAVDRVVAESVARRVPGLDPEAFTASASRVKDGLIRGARESGREVTNGEYCRALASAAGLDAEPEGLAGELEERVGECSA